MAKRLITITGATGGIGSAVAEALASPETFLFLHGCRRIAELERLASVLSKRAAGVEIFQANLANSAERGEFWRQWTEKAIRYSSADSPIDSFAWIHAAGADLMTPEMKTLAFEERLEAIGKIDVAAPVLLSRSFGKWIQVQNQKRENLPPVRGTIILFGWDGVNRGMEGDTALLYAITKGGIVAFARSLAQELAPTTRVFTVSPGWIATTWGKTASEKMNRRVRKESLLGRWGKSEEVADLAAFLVSEKSRYLNAQNIEINGGFDYRFSPEDNEK